MCNKLNIPFLTHLRSECMAKIYGYARCSTDATKQDINRQKRELKKLGVDEKNIYWEYEHGTTVDRVELNRLLEAVKKGDCIVSTEVSRLTRSTKQLCDIMQLVQDKHLKLVIGSFIIDCTTDDIEPMTKGMLMMWGVFAEMERDMISQRVKSGIENARAKGKKIGRPKMTSSELPASFYKFYPLYESKSLNMTEFAKVVGCSRKTIYNYVNIYKSSP